MNRGFESDARVEISRPVFGFTRKGRCLQMYNWQLVNVADQDKLEATERGIQDFS